MSIQQFVARSAELVGSFGNFGTMPEQVDAETLAIGNCAQIHQVLELFIKFVYRQTPDDLFINITGNGSIPTGVYTPWSAKGKGKGSAAGAPRARAFLTETERSVVSFWLKMLTAQRRYPLFFYRPAARRWYVDVLRYSDQADALTWLNKSIIDPKLYVEIKLRVAR